MREVNGLRAHSTRQLNKAVTHAGEDRSDSYLQQGWVCKHTLLQTRIEKITVMLQDIVNSSHFSQLSRHFLPVWFDNLVGWTMRGKASKERKMGLPIACTNLKHHIVLEGTNKVQHTLAKGEGNVVGYR